MLFHSKHDEFLSHWVQMGEPWLHLVALHLQRDQRFQPPPALSRGNNRQDGGKTSILNVKKKQTQEGHHRNVEASWLDLFETTNFGIDGNRSLSHAIVDSKHSEDIIKETCDTPPVQAASGFSIWLQSRIVTYRDKLSLDFHHHSLASQSFPICAMLQTSYMTVWFSNHINIYYQRSRRIPDNGLLYQSCMNPMDMYEPYGHLLLVAK